MIDVDVTLLLTVITYQSTCSHCYKLYLGSPSCLNDTIKYLLSLRVIQPWNGLLLTSGSMSLNHLKCVSVSRLHFWTSVLSHFCVFVALHISTECMYTVYGNQATGYASQHIWCLSQVRLNWEDCGRKSIWHKNGGMMEVGRWLVRMELHPSGLSACLPLAPKSPEEDFFWHWLPGVVREKGCKMVVCVCTVYAFILLDLLHYGNIPLGPCVLIVKHQCCFTTIINFYWRLSNVHLKDF